MSADDARMKGLILTRRAALLGFVAAAVLGAVHAVLGGGLPLWCYILSAVSFACVFVSMELMRRSVARKARRDA
jgi:hypothetical protein